MIGRYLNAKFVPTNYDFGLLVLRVGTGCVLFLRHGWEKVSVLTLVNPRFPDPIGIGHNASWVVAMCADGIFSVLIMLGVATRWLALFCWLNIFTAFALVHHFVFLGKSPGADHGELIALYLVAFAALMIAGPGKYSVDAKLADR